MVAHTPLSPWGLTAGGAGSFAHVIGSRTVLCPQESRQAGSRKCSSHTASFPLLWVRGRFLVSPVGMHLSFPYPFLLGFLIHFYFAKFL